MKETKPWYRSKALWLNCVAAVLVLLEVKLNIFKPFSPINFYAAMAAVLPIMNVVLRLMTSTGLTTTAR